MDLRGASAEALAELTTELDGAVRAGSHAERVGEELFSVASLLREEPSLRRVTTDVSRAPEAKQALAKQIFEGKVDEITLALVVDAVGKRWTATGDLPDALERLGEIALVKSVGTKADQLADELFGVARAVAANRELSDALANPGRSTEDKASLVDSLLDGKVLPATLALTKQALVGTYGTVTAALENYREVAATVQGEAVATVYVVQPLNDGERDRLAKVLAAQYGREVHLNEIVDPDVIGGIRVEIGDDVFDGTVSSRLDDARRKLAG
jgi:F-type H+-transporting ATPase subunit delta